MDQYPLNVLELKNIIFDAPGQLPVKMTAYKVDEQPTNVGIPQKQPKTPIETGVFICFPTQYHRYC
jgi:hypothetical protein